MCGHKVAFWASNKNSCLRIHRMNGDAQDIFQCFPLSELNDQFEVKATWTFIKTDCAQIKVKDRQENVQLQNIRKD